MRHHVVVDAPDEELTGGNSTPVVRRGDTVLRETGPWTPAVHRFLQHLDAQGMTGVPRVIGMTDDNREQLSFVPGECAQYPLPGYVWHDEVLTDVARLTRRLHDASIGCDQTGPWRSTPVGAPEVICHVDIAPYNVTFVDGRVSGIIDFDHAAPAPRLWDVAHAVYRFAPLTGGDSTDRFSTDERLARLDAFVTAYGQQWTRVEVLEVVLQRVLGLVDHAQAAADSGRPEMHHHARLYRDDVDVVRALIASID